MDWRALRRARAVDSARCVAGCRRVDRRLAFAVRTGRRAKPTAVANPRSLPRAAAVATPVQVRILRRPPSQHLLFEDDRLERAAARRRRVRPEPPLAT